MSFFSSRWLIALAAASLFAASCSSSDTSLDSGGTNSSNDSNTNVNNNPKNDSGPADPLPYGVACKEPTDCKSKLCIDGYCSKLCKKLADCEPVREDPDPDKKPGTVGGPCNDEGFCRKGLKCQSGKECVRPFNCGRVDEKTIACYPQAYDSRPHTAGHDCSADGLCGQTYTCMGQAGATGRYCSPLCETDKDCPPELRCATVQTYSGEPIKRCMRRLFGHPCDIDDHCGGPSKPESACIRDTEGNGYCSKTCSKTNPGTCPSYTKCEEAGNGRSMCKYKVGFAYDATGEGAGQCEPCIHHGEHSGKTYVEAKTCIEGGICLELSPYTREASCLAPCTADGKCPDGLGCFALDDENNFCGPTQPHPYEPGLLILAPCYPVDS